MLPALRHFYGLTVAELWDTPRDEIGRYIAALPTSGDTEADLT